MLQATKRTHNKLSKKRLNQSQNGNEHHDVQTCITKSKIITAKLHSQTEPRTAEHKHPANMNPPNHLIASKYRLEGREECAFVGINIKMQYKSVMPYLQRNEFRINS
ncbi:unnamed protein product [Lathyrus oleraceus]